MKGKGMKQLSEKQQKQLLYIKTTKAIAVYSKKFIRCNEQLITYGILF